MSKETMGPLKKAAQRQIPILLDSKNGDCPPVEKIIWEPDQHPPISPKTAQGLIIAGALIENGGDHPEHPLMQNDLIKASVEVLREMDNQERLEALKEAYSLHCQLLEQKNSKGGNSNEK